MTIEELEKRIDDNAVHIQENLEKIENNLSMINENSEKIQKNTLALEILHEYKRDKIILISILGVMLVLWAVTLFLFHM